MLVFYNLIRLAQLQAEYRQKYIHDSKLSVLNIEIYNIQNASVHPVHVVTLS